MTTTFTISITPDQTLNTAPMTFSMSLDDPTDFQTFLISYQDILHLNSNATPLDISMAWANNVMISTFNKVVSWVQTQKINAISVTAPPVVLTVANT